MKAQEGMMLSHLPLLGDSPVDLREASGGQGGRLQTVQVST